nr:hypothetical protein [Tanacetum cinerariifolium]
ECQAQYAKLGEERYESMIRYYALCDNDKQHRKKINEQEILFDRMSRQLIEMNNNVLKLQEKILEKETKISELEGCVSNKDVEIDKCLERLNACENKLHKIGQTNQTIRMIMPSKYNLYNGQKGIGFENPSYFEKEKDLRPSLYGEKVIGLGLYDSLDENNLFIFDDRVRIDNGTEFKNKTLAKFFDEAEAIATACFTQNRLIIHKRFDKTPYELLNKIKSNTKFFYVFGCKCYLLNDYDDVGKLKFKQNGKIFKSIGFTSVRNFKERFGDEYFDSLKIMKSSTTNVESYNAKVPSHEEEVFHKSSESFQEESSSSSLNDDVQQSLEEVEVPSSNTQSVSNSMVSNVDEASTSHNVFNERLEDAYFDASTSFHDSSSVHTFYQPYPYEKKWTKDHPLHKILSDPKSSVHTKGQLANSCLYSCLLSSIKPDNVAEALREADWVSAMQDELDQFARLKVWRLVSRPEGKTVIKTKWIFNNKKDESNLVI